MLQLLQRPWPWYLSGPLIGLMVPALLIMGNKNFGISSSLRHICAACFPARIPFFTYTWKKEVWNLVFVLGVLCGGFLAGSLLWNPDPIQLNPRLVADLQGHGITNFQGLVPRDLFSWQALFTAKGLILMVAGGFLVGFGTRYAGGCTSGHSITGLSFLQWPSLIATVCFMIGGIIMANLILPFVLSL